MQRNRPDKDQHDKLKISHALQDTAEASKCKDCKPKTDSHQCTKHQRAPIVNCEASATNEPDCSTGKSEGNEGD